jgi:hypothetical protein
VRADFKTRQVKGKVAGRSLQIWRACPQTGDSKITHTTPYQTTIGADKKIKKKRQTLTARKHKRKHQSKCKTPAENASHWPPAAVIASKPIRTYQNKANDGFAASCSIELAE